MQAVMLPFFFFFRKHVWVSFCVFLAGCSCLHIMGCASKPVPKHTESCGKSLLKGRQRSHPQPPSGPRPCSHLTEAVPAGGLRSVHTHTYTHTHIHTHTHTHTHHTHTHSPCLAQSEMIESLLGIIAHL